MNFETKRLAHICACLLLAGCGSTAYFDKYNPEEAYEAYVRDRTVNISPPSFNRETVVFPDAHLPGNSLPGFTVVTNQGQFLSTFDLDTGTVIIIVAQRHYIDDVGPWVREIVTRYARSVEIVPVLNLSQENWWMRSVGRLHVRSDGIERYARSIRGIPDLPAEARELGIDWRGAARDALAVRGGGPYIILAQDGVVKGFFFGRASTDSLPPHGVESPAATTAKPQAAQPSKEAVPVTTPELEELLTPPSDITPQPQPIPSPAEPQPAPPPAGTDQEIMDLLQ
jgi:hypothetical protein